jgi:hypothetical protein
VSNGGWHGDAETRKPHEEGDPVNRLQTYGFRTFVPASAKARGCSGASRIQRTGTHAPCAA